MVNPARGSAGNAGVGLRLEPHVLHASPVARQVLEISEAVEMVDEQGADLVRFFSRTHVDGDAATSVLVGRHRAPCDDAPTSPAEMKADIGVASRIDLRRAGDLNLLALVPVDPQSALAATDRVVARGGAFHRPLEGPAHRAAMTDALDHLHLRASAARRCALASDLSPGIRRCRYSKVIRPSTLASTFPVAAM